MDPKKKELYLHSLMCIVGGFFGGYAVLSHSGTFGSAQTLNMVEIVCAILGRDYYQFFLRLICLILYISGIFIALTLSKKSTFLTQRYSIMVDVVGALLLCLIPANIDTMICLMPIFFMMATQWTIFHGNGKYNSSTIFSTNNLKQLTLSLGEYILERDGAQLDKAKFFANSLLWYHIGVMVSFFACRAFALRASLCALPLTFLALALTYAPANENSENKEKKIIEDGLLTMATERMAHYKPAPAISVDEMNRRRGITEEDLSH